MYRIRKIKIFFNNAGKEITKPEKQTNNNQPARAPVLSALKDNNDDNSHNSHSLLSAYSAKAVLSALQATALRGKYRYAPNFAGNQGREIK